MSDTSSSPAATKSADLKLPIPLWELVPMVASMMALNALAIDVMLPALNKISQHYELAHANQQQWVVFFYIAGFGIPQLFFGPIADRFGRKGLLQICLLGYILTGIACMLTSAFWMLLFMRFTQGVFAAGIRVIASSVVRDLMAGRAMARVMSLVMTVFMVVPILAPSIGAAIMLFAAWQWTFGVLSVCGMLLFIWVQFRLPETQPREARQPLNLQHSISAYRQVFQSRVTFGYMAASGVIFGALFSFVAASEQVFREVFDQGEYFALWFAGIAATLAVANLTNSSIVERFGMRLIGHLALCAFIITVVLNIVLLSLFGEHLAIFFPLFCLNFACFGMIGSNFSALALEPLGKIAGTAAAAYGFATSAGSSVLGFIVASQYNGSVIPIMFGFLALGVSALTIVAITERGRLFQASER